MANLPSTDNTYNNLPQGLPGGSGSSLDTSSGGFDWSKIGQGLLPLGLSMLAPKSRDINPEVNAIESGAGDLKKTGADLLSGGKSAMSTALKYFQGLVSGDPSAILSATAPDRARVMDQYDASRKAITSFSPRGGGAASSMNENRTKEASDLSTITSSARSNAATELGRLGASQEQAGISAEEQSINALVQTLGPLLAQEQSSKQDTSAMFSGIGNLIGAAMFA